MKKYIALLLALVMALSFAGCGKQPVAKTDDSGDKIKIVTTIFPEYDWVRELLGEQAENAELTLLLDNGVDLHSYQPTADDVVKIASCDLFIYVGGESDEWVEDALKEAANPDMQVIELLGLLGDSVKEEELAEGMQESEEEHEGSEAEEGPEYDEHVWLSLKNAQIIVNAIAEKLAELDAEHKDIYIANAAAYTAKLAKLDAEYQKAVDEAGFKTLVFGDRFPFRYLVDDYGLDYYAAFAGCSAESEASFETVVFLANKLDELKLHNVMVIESSDKKIADAVAQNTAGKDQKILVLDSMQSTDAKDIEAGADYLSIMENNLAVLKEALN